MINSNKNSNKNTHKLRIISILTLWLLAFICFGLGVFLPIAEIKKFYLFSNEFSLVDSLIQLLVQFSLENIIIFTILFLFTFCFPLIKLGVLFGNIIKPDIFKHSQLFKWASHLAKLSMIDVFVIALMVLLLKLGVLVSVSVHSGFYFFTTSVLISLVLTTWVKKSYN